jgi:hypothetical protein
VPNHHHSQINLSIQRESYEGDDVATATRSSHIEKSDATHRKSFSESFFFIKGAPWKPKLNSNRASGNHSGAQLGRRMISANPGMENDIEAAIAHCKQSLSADPKSMIDTCAEIYADSHVHCHSRSSSSNHIPLGKTVGSYSSIETRFG